MHDYSFHVQRINEKKLQGRKKNKLKGYLILIFLLLFIFLVIYSRFTAGNENTVPAITSSKSDSPINSLTPNATAVTLPAETKGLIAAIGNILDNVPGSYSVSIYDLKNNREYGINQQMVLTAASVNKIPIMATLYFLAAKKEIDLEDTITLQAKDIQDYGTGSIRYDKPGTIYSIKTLGRLMMEKSDNTAAFILGQHLIGTAKIQNLIEQWGLTQTNIEENKTSAKDMGILMRKIYKGEIVQNQSLNTEMLDFMDKSDFEERIPTGIPDPVTVYHKIGDEVGKVHDVGIIDLPGHPYYLGVLTSDISNEEQAKKTIADISRLVFEYMEKN